MPTLAAIMMMRQNEEEAYKIFCDEVLSQVVGKLEWKTSRHSRAITQWATTSDEAFAIVLLENSWDLWVEMSEHEHQNKGKKGHITFVKTKESLYTRSGAGTKKYGGWTAIGLKRFGEIANMVQADRVSNTGISFETEYQAAWRSSAKTSNRKRRRIQEDGDCFEIYMDGDDVADAVDGAVPAS
jgi:hypothetical protein